MMKFVLSCVVALSVGELASSAPRFPFLQRGGSRGRVLAKNEQETVDLQVAPPLSQSTKVKTEVDAPLLQDIDSLSDILSDIVNREDPQSHNLYEEFRKYGLQRADDPNDVTALNNMIQRASELTPQQALGMMRSFSIMLNLINSAEVHHRNRVTRQHDSQYKEDTSPEGPLPLTEDSIRGTMDALLSSGLATKEDIYEQIVRQKVEIVLTAHPTQVQRKSLLRKYRKISETLAYLERPDLDRYERTSGKLGLVRIVSSIWGADEIRRNKPTPQQEAAGGNAVLESVLWDAVPAYLRKLDVQCEMTLGKTIAG